MPPTDKRTNIEWLNFERSGPPGLDKETDPATMDAGSSPDAYGINLDTENRLAKGSIPTGTARINKTFTVNSNVYDWVYQRLWRFSTNELIYGAIHYTDSYYKQGIGKIVYDEDAQAIIEILPFGGDSLAIAKSTGAYVLSNLNDTRGEAFWGRGDIIQEIKLATAVNATELDAAAYFSTTDGLYSLSAQGEVTEITRRVRNTLGSFSNVALTCDYQKKRIIGTAKFVYDVERQKLYDYGTSGFRYTSPDLHAGDYAPIKVTRMHFAVQNASSPLSDQEFTLQFKTEERDWEDAERVDILDDRGHYSMVTIEPEMFGVTENTRRLKFRITDMSNNLRIRAVYFDAADGAFNLYSE